MTINAHDLQRWHPGELSLQEARGFADEVMEGPGGLQPVLLYGSASFLAQLQLLPVTTLDDKGRPWVSLLAGRGGDDGWIDVVSSKDEDGEDMETMRFKEVVLPEGTPLLGCIDGNKGSSSSGGGSRRKLAASVGVLFTNRRRNKYEGWIQGAKRVDGDVWDVDFGVTASMGNCPKYINLRALLPTPTHKPQLTHSSLDHPPGFPLPSSITSAIDATDTIWLGTFHTADPLHYGDRDKAGCNIRGGRRGFIQHHWDEKRNRHCLLLPDFSGNRFVQSLGNIAGGDKVAGVTIPVFKADGRGTDVVYLTCEAEVLSGDEARAVMRGFSGVTKLWVTGFVRIDDALPLRMAGGDEAVGWSPYNPIVRGAATQEALPLSAEAKLVDVELHSESLATFHWSAPREVCKHYKAGQHVIVDASRLLDTRVTLYAHMTRYPGGEKELNDDGTRSWTISRSWFDDQGDTDGQWRFTTTLRRVPRGGVTPSLFSMAQRILAARQEEGAAADAMPPWAPRLPILGVEGEFCTSSSEDESGGERSVYVCNGIGITPLLAHISGRRRAVAGSDEPVTKVDVLAIVACRGDELDVVRSLVDAAAGYGGKDDDGFELRVHYLVRSDEAASSGPTTLSPGATAWHGARLTTSSFMGGNEARTAKADFAIPSKEVTGRTAYVCGTRSFESTAKTALSAAGVDVIRTESFSY